MWLNLMHIPTYFTLIKYRNKCILGAGDGVFAVKDIKKGQLVGLYAGAIHDASEVSRSKH